MTRDVAMKLSKAAALVVLCALVFGASGCMVLKPWERETLSRRDMSWAPDPLESARDSHIHFSKEAAMPGGSGGGGGCGCN